MEQEQLTLYKLMILYLIEKVDFPLSNSQISEFILDKGYTNYFTVQRAFHELEEENMLRVKQIRNMSITRSVTRDLKQLRCLNTRFQTLSKKILLSF